MKRDPTDQSDPTDPTDLTDLTDEERWLFYARWLEAPEAATRANTIICLIHQANYLLDRQIVALEEAFVEGGGYSEQLATERMRQRRKDQTDRSDQTDPADLKPPACPQCGALMALRTAKSGKTLGSQFWGCTAYPECKATCKI